MLVLLQEAVAVANRGGHDEFTTVGVSCQQGAAASIVFGSQAMFFEADRGLNPNRDYCSIVGSRGFNSHDARTASVDYPLGIRLLAGPRDPQQYFWELMLPTRVLVVFALAVVAARWGLPPLLRATRVKRRAA